MPPKKDAKGKEVKKKAPLTPADKGCEYIRANESENLVKVLEEEKKFLNKHEAKSGKNMLHVAVEEGKQQFVDMLIDYGAKINFRTKLQLTACMLAAELPEDDILLFLIANGAKLFITGRLGDTALHICTRRGHKSTVEIIIEEMKAVVEAQEAAAEAEAELLAEEENDDGEEEEDEQEGEEGGHKSRPGSPLGVTIAPGSPDVAPAAAQEMVPVPGSPVASAPEGGEGAPPSVAADGAAPADGVAAAPAELGEGGGVPGTVLDDQLTVACASGALRLTQVQRAGRGPMAAADFLRGYELPPGSRLS